MGQNTEQPTGKSPFRHVRKRYEETIAQYKRQTRKEFLKWFIPALLTAIGVVLAIIALLPKAPTQ